MASDVDAGVDEQADVSSTATAKPKNSFPRMQTSIASECSVSPVRCVGSFTTIPLACRLSTVSDIS